MQVPTPDSIKFVSTKKLIEEVFDRFDACIFVGNKEQTKNDAALGWHAKGDYFILVGLNAWISNRIDEMEPNDPNV